MTDAAFIRLIAGILGIAAGVGAFATYIVSSPRRRLWLPMPGYVRLPTMIFGIFLVWRGFDQLRLAFLPNATDYTGAPLGLIECGMAVWYFGAVAISVWRTKAASALWSRLREEAAAFYQTGGEP